MLSLHPLFLLVKSRHLESAEVVYEGPEGP